MLNILTLSLYKKKNFKTEEMMGACMASTPEPVPIYQQKWKKNNNKKKKKRFGMITIRHPKFKIDKSKSNCIKL